MSESSSTSDESAFASTIGNLAATRPGIGPGTLGAGAATAADDSSFDLSLRLLTALVIVALAGSIGLLGYRWLAPRLTQHDAGPVAAQTRRAAPAAVDSDADPTHPDEVLMAPGHVFRCVEQGRVTFSDQACPGAPPAAPAPAAPAGPGPAR